jgi:hypothetical protein
MLVPDIARLLAPDVQHIRYDIAQDWSGDWAIFFRVVLSDEASKNRLRELTSKVVSQLAARLDFSGMGLFAYHNFRSVSEAGQSSAGGVHRLLCAVSLVDR